MGSTRDSIEQRRGSEVGDRAAEVATQHAAEYSPQHAVKALLDAIRKREKEHVQEDDQRSGEPGP